MPYYQAGAPVKPGMKAVLRRWLKLFRRRQGRLRYEQFPRGRALLAKIAKGR